MVLFEVKNQPLSTAALWVSSGASSAHPWVEEQVDVLVQQGLVLLVSCTEIL